jgi:transglutaminase-like putative cysteine protease
VRNIILSKALTVVGLVCVLAATSVAEDNRTDQDDVPRTRSFQLDYGATLTDLPVDARVRVWLPVPQSNDHQDVRPLESVLPSKGTVNIEPVYGNRILHFESQAAASGRLSFSTSYQVHRREVRGLDGESDLRNLSASEREQFLAANAKVPLEGKPLNLLEGIQFPRGPLAVARTLYERVDDHVRYDKSQPGYGNGDVLWVCDSRFGNCTDFHSLFISLARSKGIPARFEIGLPLPPERGKGTIGGYHCWALFHTDDSGWVPVDISEADKHPGMKDYYFGNLTENRVAFSVGRDIQLVPRQDGEPLNYFVYPYVEVDGKVWPRDGIKLSLSYSDTPEPTSPRRQ